MGDGVAGGFVAGADNGSTFDTSAGENHSLALGPVITAGIFIDAGSASHFAHHNDECFIEESALIEVGEECEEGAVSGRYEGFFVAGEVIEVGIPAAVFDADEAAPCFDEPSGHQGALSDGRHAIFFADGAIFGLEVEGLSGFGGCDEVDGFFVVGLECLRSSGSGGSGAEEFGLVEQLLSACEAIFCDAFGEVEIADAEVCLDGVIIDGEGRIFRAVEAGASGTERVGDFNIGRNGAAGAEFTGDDGAD